MSPSSPRSVKHLLRLWPSLAECAADIPCGYEAVKQWSNRQSIPVRYWPDVIASAERRGIAGIDADLLMRLHTSPDPSQPLSHCGAPVTEQAEVLS